MNLQTVLLGCILLIVCVAALASAQTCSVDTFRSFTKKNGLSEIVTQTFDQDECFALECTVVQNDNHLRTIELQGASGLIYYIEKKFNETLYDTFVESIDSSTDTNRYTVYTKARNKNNGEAFTCQCGVSKSVTITVTDKGFGNCDGVTTTITGTDEDNVAIGPFTEDARSCTEKNFVMRKLVFDQKQYKNLNIIFKKPAACTGLIQLWGEKEGDRTDCQLDINSTVQGDNHTFSIVQRSKTAFTGGFPNCTEDGLPAFDQTIRVMLVSPTDSNTKHEELLVTTLGLFPLTDDNVVTDGSVAGGITIVVAVIGGIVAGGGLFFWLTKTAGLGATGTGKPRKKQTIAILALFLVVFLGFLIGAIVLIVTDEKDLAIVIIVPLFSILCLIGAIAFLVWSWTHWRHPAKGTEKLGDDVDGHKGKPGGGGGGYDNGKTTSNGTAHYDGKEAKLDKERRPLPARKNENGQTQDPATKHIDDAVNNSKSPGRLPPLNTSHDNRGYEPDPVSDGGGLSTPARTVSAGDVSPKVSMTQVHT